MTDESKVDYIARRIERPVTVDGDIEKSVWKEAQWTSRFVDMVSGEPGLYETRTAIVWSDTHLHVAFWAEEPFVEAHLTERDSLMFLENDLELFIDGGDCYYELEVNAANTVYEVFFVWRDAYKPGGRFDRPEFDVHNPRAYTFGGDYDRTGPHFWKGTHPRGIRWAFTGYDLPGLQTAVRVDGILNDRSQIHRGWSLEIAIPWASLTLLAGNRSLPPKNGDVWRFFLGRFQKLLLGGKEVNPHPAMVHKAHGIYDTHRPESWSVVRFSDELSPGR